jgi:hypothetical protein
MTFHSILFRHAHTDLRIDPTEAPEFFHDLNIDQLVAGVTGKDEYDLKPFFYRQLGDVDEIAYRQEVMKDRARSRSKSRTFKIIPGEPLRITHERWPRLSEGKRALLSAHIVLFCYFTTSTPQGASLTSRSAVPPMIRS